MRVKKLLAYVMSLVMLVSLAACGQPTDSTDQSGNSTSQPAVLSMAYPGTPGQDSVVLDITSEPLEMNTMLAYDTAAMTVLSHCMSGLTKLDANDQPEADLAERWEISEDKTVYTMYLRKDAKWSNGDSVTANDFYYSWVSQMKPETGSYMVSFLYKNIKNGEAFYDGETDESQLGLQVVDDYTLRIEWERPMADGLFLLSLTAYLPVNQKAYESIGADAYAKEADNMVTNGAYRIAKWVHDDHILLEKSDTYYDADSIKIPEVKLVMLSDPTTRSNAFMAGEIDLCNLYSEQISQIKDKDSSAVQSYLDGGTWYLGFNMKNEYLQNKNLRQALAYSIDVQSLLDNVIADGSVAASGLIPSTIAGADGKSYADARGSLFAYDLDRAKACMDKAMSELQMTPADVALTLDVANTTYNQNQAAYIQQQWKNNLGIEVTVNAQPWNALQEAKFNGDFAISVEANSAVENSPTSFLSSFLSDDAGNVVSYNNSDYNALLQSAKMESDPQKRQDLFIQAETMLIEDSAIAPLYFTCTTYAISGKLQGLVRTPFQMFSLRDAEISK